MEKTAFTARKHGAALWLVGYRAASDAAGKGAYFVITIVAARRLTEASFALFSLASVFGWMLALGTDCGMQVHVARAVARAPARAGAVLQSWLRIRFWTAGLALAAVVAGLAIWPVRRGVALPVLLFAAVYVINGLTEFLNYFYRGLSRSDIESSLTLWQRGGLLGCGLPALAWHPDVTWLAIAMLVPAAGALALSLRFAARVSPRVSGEMPAAIPMRRFEEFRRGAMPIGAGIVLSALYFRIDLFLVQWWQGGDAVALYNAAFRLVDALRLLPAAVLAVGLPAIFNARNGAPLARLALPLTVFALASSLLLWSTAGWAIPLVYGAPYAAAVPAFRILVWAFPLLSLNYALTHQLIGWDGQRAYAGICAVALAVNLALNARLIPTWSIDGAAWATLLTEAVLTVGCALALPGARRTSVRRLDGANRLAVERVP